MMTATSLLTVGPLYMLLDFLFNIWRRLNGEVQWRLLWLFNSKFMLSVAGVILDRQDRVLLQRHRHWVKDVWGLPGGIVQRGERLEEAFAREVCEETGLDITDISLLEIHSGYNIRLEVFFQARLAASDAPPALRLQKMEVLEARFFPLDQLPAAMLPDQRALVEKIRRS